MFDRIRNAPLWRPTKPWSEWKAQRDALLRKFINEQLYPYSPYYRRLFERAKIDPEKIRTLDDLRRLPFTTKHDIAPTAENPARHLDLVLQPNAELIRRYAPKPQLVKLAWAKMLGGDAAATELVRREYAPVHLTFTTGRTALPTQFLYAPCDFERLVLCGKRLFDVLGCDRREYILNVFPYAPHLAFWQTVAGGWATTNLILSTGGGKVMGTAGNLAALRRMQPSMLVGVPGYVYHLLREAVEKAIRVTSLKRIALGAERVPPALKRRLAELSAQLGSPGVTVQGTYGFTEARLAWAECPAPDHETSYGYHTFPDLEIFEIVDPQAGEPVGPGERGEVVYSNLTGHGSCVLRYRTGDIAEGGVVYDPCPGCDRIMPRISSRLSRISDVDEFRLTKIRGTLVNLSNFLPAMSDVPDVIEWQLVVRKMNEDPNDLDELILSIAVRDGADTQALKVLLKQKLLAATEVAPNQIDVLPLAQLTSDLGLDTQMKELRIRDLRGQAKAVN
jgi:phenylacetate-coenzyme A ligase PaaK-like adenylate-forming protein